MDLFALEVNGFNCSKADITTYKWSHGAMPKINSVPIESLEQYESFLSSCKDVKYGNGSSSQSYYNKGILKLSSRYNEKKENIAKQILLFKESTKIKLLLKNHFDFQEKIAQSLKVSLAGTVGLDINCFDSCIEELIQNKSAEYSFADLMKTSRDIVSAVNQGKEFALKNNIANLSLSTFLGNEPDYLIKIQNNLQAYLQSSKYFDHFINYRAKGVKSYIDEVSRIASWLESYPDQIIKYHDGTNERKALEAQHSNSLKVLNLTDSYLQRLGVDKDITQKLSPSLNDLEDSFYTAKDLFKKADLAKEKYEQEQKELAERIKKNTGEFYKKVSNSNLASVLKKKGFPDKPFAYGADHARVLGIDSMYAYLSCFVLTSENKKFAIKSKATSFEVTIGDYRNNIFEPRLKLGIRMDGDLYFLESLGDPNQKARLHRNSQTTHQFSYASAMKVMTCSRDLEIELNEFERDIQQ